MMRFWNTLCWFSKFFDHEHDIFLGLVKWCLLLGLNLRGNKKLRINQIGSGNIYIYILNVWEHGSITPLIGPLLVDIWEGDTRRRNTGLDGNNFELMYYEQPRDTMSEELRKMRGIDGEEQFSSEEKEHNRRDRFQAVTGEENTVMIGERKEDVIKKRVREGEEA